MKRWAGLCLVLLLVVLLLGAPGFAVASATTGIWQAPQAQVQEAPFGLELWEGWNLIAWQWPTMPVTLAAQIVPGLETVWWLNNQTKEWLSWNREVPWHVSTLQALTTRQPYWFYATADFP